MFSTFSHSLSHMVIWFFLIYVTIIFENLLELLKVKIMLKNI